jgi:histidine ammonia-lyase
LESVRARIRADVAHLDEDRYFHDDIQKSLRLVRSGAIVAAANLDTIPGV